MKHGVPSYMTRSKSPQSFAIWTSLERYFQKIMNSLETQLLLTKIRSQRYPCRKLSMANFFLGTQNSKLIISSVSLQPSSASQFFEFNGITMNQPKGVSSCMYFRGIEAPLCAALSFCAYVVSSGFSRFPPISRLRAYGFFVLSLSYLKCFKNLPLAEIRLFKLPSAQTRCLEMLYTFSTAYRWQPANPVFINEPSGFRLTIGRTSSVFKNHQQRA